jgi:hypothetical protein
MRFCEPVTLHEQQGTTTHTKINNYKINKKHFKQEISLSK